MILLKSLRKHAKLCFHYKLCFKNRAQHSFSFISFHLWSSCPFLCNILAFNKVSKTHVHVELVTLYFIRVLVILKSNLCLAPCKYTNTLWSGGNVGFQCEIPQFTEIFVDYFGEFPMILLDFMATRIRFMKQIRILEAEMKQIHTDPDPEHCFQQLNLHAI